jgi:hypothetical protein
MNNKELVTALADLLTSVTFKSETVNFNGEDCYEARVPVGFVVDARCALDNASKAHTARTGYFERSPQGGIQYVSGIPRSNLHIRKLADYLSKQSLCSFEYAEELLDRYFGNSANFAIPQSSKESPFNSAAETRECMLRYAKIRKREMNNILENLSNQVNVMTTEAAAMGNNGVSITYADHLSQYFPKPKLEYVFSALTNELTSVGYDVKFNLPYEIIHIRW